MFDINLLNFSSVNLSELYYKKQGENVNYSITRIKIWYMHSYTLSNMSTRTQIDYDAAFWPHYT